MSRKLYVAASNGVTHPDPSERELIGHVFAELDALPRSQAAEQMRALGVSLPENPTSDDFRVAWETIEQRLAASSRLERFLAVQAGTDDPETLLAYVTEIKASHAELPKLQARIVELERAQEAAQLDNLVSQAKRDRKLTPFMEAKIRESFASGTINLKGAQVWLSSMLPIPALQDPPKPGSGGDFRFKWNGKTYAELKPVERAELRKENQELFNVMRQEARQV